jgi:osmoprotectant transport system permease protein
MTIAPQRLSLRQWQGLGTAVALWVLIFFLFSQQAWWAAVLGSVFPNADPVLFERATLLTLVLQHLQISFTSMAIVILVGLPLAIFCTRRQGLAFLPLVENIVAVGQTFPPVAVLFLRLLELPLALPAILAGLRSSLVLIIATTSIAPLVGTGGLGVPMLAGLTTNNTSLLLEGAIPVALLALLSDYTMRAIEQLLTPWRS